MSGLKRFASLPREVLVVVARASKADLAEALAIQLALTHPVGADDAMDDPHWLAGAMAEAVNAERVRRGAKRIKAAP